MTSRYQRRRRFRCNVTCTTRVPWMQLAQAERDELRAHAASFTDEALVSCWRQVGHQLVEEDLTAFAYVCTELGCERDDELVGWMARAHDLVRADRRHAALVVLSCSAYLADRARFNRGGDD